MEIEDILVKRKKVSDPSIPELEVLDGFKILGVGPQNQTAKVDLGLIRQGVEEIIEETGTAAQSALDAEALIVAAEGDETSGRVKAELDRETAENAREQAESLRAAAEGDENSGRVKAELDRETAEDAREQAESLRATAEGDETSGRVKAELDRETAEDAREQAESLRAAALNFHYIRYASDDQGTGFSAIPSDELKYRGEIHSADPIASPVSGDFEGKWLKYISDVTAADLALKAAHGYTSNPKTLKEIDDKTVQIESDLNDTTELTTAEAISVLFKELAGVKALLAKLITGEAWIDKLLVMSELNLFGSTNLIIKATAAPVPDFIGQIFINTTSAPYPGYIAIGTTSVSDWKQITN